MNRRLNHQRTFSTGSVDKLSAESLEVIFCIPEKVFSLELIEKARGLLKSKHEID